MILAETEVGVIPPHEKEAKPIGVLDIFADIVFAFLLLPFAYGWRLHR